MGRDNDKCSLTCPLIVATFTNLLLLAGPREESRVVVRVERKEKEIRGIREVALAEEVQERGLCHLRSV